MIPYKLSHINILRQIMFDCKTGQLIGLIFIMFDCKTGQLIGLIFIMFNCKTGQLIGLTFIDPRTDGRRFCSWKRRRRKNDGRGWIPNAGRRNSIQQKESRSGNFWKIGLAEYFWIINYNYFWELNSFQIIFKLKYWLKLVSLNFTCIDKL